MSLNIWDKSVIKKMAINFCERRGIDPLETYGPNKKDKNWHKLATEVREVIGEIETAGYVVLPEKMANTLIAKTERLLNEAEEKDILISKLRSEI